MMHEGPDCVGKVVHLVIRNTCKGCGLSTKVPYTFNLRSIIVTHMKMVAQTWATKPTLRRSQHSPIIGRYRAQLLIDY